MPRNSLAKVNTIIIYMYLCIKKDSTIEMNLKKYLKRQKKIDCYKECCRGTYPITLFVKRYTLHLHTKKIFSSCLNTD